MKKIYFGPKGTVNWHEFFWKPWGLLGCFGRLLLFMLLLFFLLLLLSLFRSCNKLHPAIPNDILNPIANDSTSSNSPIVKVPIDTTTTFPKDIANPGNNLPSPEDNYLPPVSDDDVITDDDNRRIVGNKLNIILDSQSNDDTFRQWADEFKANYPDGQYSIVYYDPKTKLLQIQIPAEERDVIMQNLPQQITDISFKVFPEGMMGGMAVSPNDPAFKHPEICWYFEPIQVYEAWEITQGSNEVVVAIVDSYFDLGHDDLNSSRVVRPYSVSRRTGNVAPALGCDEISFMHGSMVASQALGTINNGRGAAGIAPNCKFMPISMGHQFTSMTILQGLLYSIYQGAQVVNISAGAQFDEAIHNSPVDEQIQASKKMGLAEQSVWDYAFKLANERNVTIVWAAGNSDIFTALDPSKRGNATIKVSAVDKELHKATFSDFGNFQERGVEESTISAPGVEIFGAKPYNTYDIGPGTSFAAPIVTGAVALMKSLDPTLSTEDIISILQETGKPVEGCTTIGKLIQIKDALLRVKKNFVKFNDIMNDHSKLIGLWESTELLTKTIDGQPTGDFNRLYFDIRTIQSGNMIAYEATSSKQDFTAPLTISWSTNKITLTQTIPATNPNMPNRYVVAEYNCTADSNGLLQCVSSSQYGTTSPYYLKKIIKRKLE